MSWLILLALLKKLDKKIDDLETVTFRKVDELPATGEANVIYFVPKTDAEEGNYSDEYIWDSASESYEQIGDSAIDPLPEVTAADNGKVLGVANGEWDKINIDNIIIYTGSYNYNTSSGTFANGKTCSNIYNDVISGKVCVLLLNPTNGTQKKALFIPTSYQNQNPIFTSLNFKQMSYNDYDVNKYVFASITITNSNSSNFSIIPNEFSSLPSPGSGSSSNHEGKSLIYDPNASRPYLKWAFPYIYSIAPKYSANSTYDIGDLVYHIDETNNDRNWCLYECTTAISTAESWTAAHWTQVKVSDELDKKADLTDIPADANHNIASAYDSTATYAVGDLCIYNGNLYECSTAISTAEAWDSTHWTQKTVAQELAGLGNSIDIWECTENNDKVYLPSGKTVADLRAKMTSSTPCILHTNASSFIPGFGLSSSGGGGSITFYCISYTSDTRTASMIITASSSNDSQNYLTMYTSYGVKSGAYLLPYLNNSDEGKVLMAVSGRTWAARYIRDFPLGSLYGAWVQQEDENGNFIYATLGDGKKIQDISAWSANNKGPAFVSVHPMSPNNERTYIFIFNHNTQTNGQTGEVKTLYGFCIVDSKIIYAHASNMNSNILYFTYKNLDELPAVTSSDEGKVLTVNSNGAWVASALPDGTNQQY